MLLVIHYNMHTFVAVVTSIFFGLKHIYVITLYTCFNCKYGMNPNEDT